MRTSSATVRNTILGTCVKALGRALDSAGCDGAALLTQAGFNLRELDGPDTRCPIAKLGRLWHIALAATGDPAFGLKVAREYKHTTFHALGYGVSASSSLKEAFERIERFSHVVSDAVEYRLDRYEEEYHFFIEPTIEVPVESIDALVAMYLQLCRSLIGRSFTPLMVELRRPRPDVVDVFERSWRAPLAFGAEQTRLIVDRRSFDTLLDSGNPELARLSDVMSSQYLARIERHNLDAQVRKVLTRRRLQDRDPSPEKVAELLNMSARTLQRKLKVSGTSFKDILNETRHAFAVAYLSVPQYSVNEITQWLGFSCTGSFTRAFRRWTGLAPTDWRATGASRYLNSRQRMLLDPARFQRN